MMYPYMTLPDGTEVAHSEMKKDGRVKVYIEKPDAEFGFRHATCWLPEYQWTDIVGFDDAQMAAYRRFVEKNAHLLWEYSQEGGILSDAVVV